MTSAVTGAAADCETLCITHLLSFHPAHYSTYLSAEMTESLAAWKGSHFHRVTALGHFFLYPIDGWQDMAKSHCRHAGFTIQHMFKLGIGDIQLLPAVSPQSR